MAHPSYLVVRCFPEGSDSYLTLADPQVTLQDDEKKVRAGTLAQLIEWARVRKNGDSLIQQFLDEAVWLQRDIFPLTHQ
ncbi:hypothetical protein COV05_02020 [Candidatus Uhrbacteria bacterium CG10_big_fil_rev_8_21_14_0_10_48_16]|uniref:Uncharacterized protein n=1 Tax=Candidatus Uhrbacteria bacterium CG10_big_fil_rev_8_21_14_0_10_48_16 TaxID=1975038 RepID=A0A2M8LHN5_9BACT|nr:MAG: hypothetical protein COV05_02020 [Candidatus Uhrbacteria bacterium CG10_big_fil_rev_8_21_14_0_10_48_16]